MSDIVERITKPPYPLSAMATKLLSEAAAEITRLRDENAELKKCWEICSAADKLYQEAIAAKDKALEPFAAVLDNGRCSALPGNAVLAIRWGNPGDMGCVTVADLRRARAAITGGRE